MEQRMRLKTPTSFAANLEQAAPVSFPDRAWRVILGATLIVYALIQFLYITATPLQVMTLPDNLPRNAPQSLLVGIGPDEKEHFLYLLSLANRGTVPKPATRWRTAPEQYVSYQAQHPPVFYAVGAVLYQAVRRLPPASVWYLLRGFCALCGGVVIVLAALAARAAFPHQPFLVLTTAPLIAFLPMFGHLMGNLSNEPLAMVFTAGGVASNGATGAWGQTVHACVRRSFGPDAGTGGGNPFHRRHLAAGGIDGAGFLRPAAEAGGSAADSARFLCVSPAWFAPGFCTIMRPMARLCCGLLIARCCKAIPWLRLSLTLDLLPLRSKPSCGMRPPPGLPSG